MAEKRLNTRIVHKHETEANWLLSSLIPMQGELIVYDIDENHSYERIKIGDGEKNVNALPFVDDALRSTLVEQINGVDSKIGAVSALVGDTSVSEQIDTAIESSQANWDQNDPTASDYVNGRTHWVESVEPEVIFNGTVTTSGVGVAHFGYLEMSKPLVEGVQYLVTFNGKDYLLTAAFDGDFVYIGDINYEYTTIPFVLYNDIGSEQMFETSSNGNWNLTVKIVHDTVHQLDEKFIPDTIARVSNWTKIYDSGASGKNVNAFAYINVLGYKNIMVAIKAVNTTKSSGNTGGAVSFTGQSGQVYSFRNILPDLIKNTAVTTGGMAIFRIADGFIVCENAMRSTSADNMFSNTEGVGTDNMTPVGGGLVRCTDTIVRMNVTNTNSSSTHYYGTGSRVIVWGCTA